MTSPTDDERALREELNALRERVRELEEEKAGLERALAPAEAERSYARLDDATATRALLDATVQVALLINPDSTIIACNDALASRFGLSTGELVGRRFWDIFPEDVAARRSAWIEQVLRTKERGEFVDERAGVTMESYITPVLDEHGEVALLAIYSRDVTAQWSDIEQIKRDHALLSAVIEGTQDAIYAKDKDTRLIMLNTACAEILGASPGELLGKANHEIVPNEKIAAAITSYDQEVMAGGVPVTNEETLFVGDTRRVYLSTKAPLRNAVGEVIGLLGVSRDITQRKEAEEALRQSERKFRALSESSPMGAFWADREGVVLFTNRRWQEITGLGLDESLGDGWLNALHPHDREPVATGWQRCIEQALSWAGEFRFCRPDGSVRTVFTRSAPVRSETGELLGFVGANEDITERREMEVEIQKAQRLESLGTLAGGIAHDFNNLLTALWGNMQIIATQLGPESDMIEMLFDSMAACRQAARLTSQLLTFAKGGAPLRKVQSLGTLVLESSRYAKRDAAIQCEVELPDDLWVAEVDASQIAQVLHNLVINAVQAMPAGGSIRVVAKNLVSQGRVPNLLPGKYVKIEVTDAGCGIAEEHLQRIFDPYFTTKPSGSGLGLATAFSIVRRHGGVITAESTWDVGSTFSVYLPALDEVPTEAEEPPLEQAVVHEGKILIMDDEPKVRRILARSLHRLGYSVVNASGGDEAVERYAKALVSDAPFRAVILDLTVTSGMGGVETLRALEKLDPAVKAIVTSGYSSDPVMSQFPTHGFAGVLEKPFELNTLSDVLTRVLHTSGGQVRDP